MHTPPFPLVPYEGREVFRSLRFNDTELEAGHATGVLNLAPFVVVDRFANGNYVDLYTPEGKLWGTLYCGSYLMFYAEDCLEDFWVLFAHTTGVAKPC